METDFPGWSKWESSGDFYNTGIFPPVFPSRTVSWEITVRSSGYGVVVFKMYSETLHIGYPTLLTDTNSDTL